MYPDAPAWPTTAYENATMANDMDTRGKPYSVGGNRFSNVIIGNTSEVTFVVNRREDEHSGLSERCQHIVYG